MTPKEKAKQLVEKFKPHTYSAVFAHKTSGEDYDAIKCALKCVDELIENNFWEDKTSKENYFEYWNEVRYELEISFK